MDFGDKFQRLISTKAYGLLLVIYGLILALSNLINNTGNGNVVGFGLIAVYGAYVALREDDGSYWIRFKCVNGFIMVFGLAYIVRGLLGAEGIAVGDSIIYGIIILGIGVYMMMKVYRMESNGRRPFTSRVLYTLFWLLIVLFLAMGIVGVFSEPGSLIEGADITEQICNLLAGVFSVLTMLETLIYYLIFCRPGQMKAEVDYNVKLNDEATKFNDENPLYTMGDAVKDSRSARSQNNFRDYYGGKFIDAVHDSGYKTDFETEQAIKELVMDYYPSITWSQAKEVANAIGRACHDYSLSEKIIRNLSSLDFK